MTITEGNGAFLQNFPANAGSMWHADETAVRVKGEAMWIWEVMDSETRFILSSMMTPWGRKDEDAIAILRAAHERSTGLPATLRTDGAGAYHAGLRWQLRGRTETVNQELVGMAGNARIERYHGTFKDRYRVMRNFKSFRSASAIGLGFAVHYNFLREHSTLKMTHVWVARGEALSQGVVLPA